MNYRIEQFLAIAAVSFITIFFSCCTVGAGEGYARGEVSIPDYSLNNENFDMGIDTFMADFDNNQVRITLQKGGDRKVFSDGILILVRDVELVSEKIEEADGGAVSFDVRLRPSYAEYLDAGLVGEKPAPAPENPVASYLYLNRTCPHNRYGLTAAEGKVEFSSIFMPDKEDRLAGEFDLLFLDPREWNGDNDPGPSAHLEGRFDFKYSRGQPAQPFP